MVFNSDQANDISKSNFLSNLQMQARNIMNRCLLFIICSLLVILMPKLFFQYLEGHNIYTCKKCGTHLTSLSELISRQYRSQHGSAFLFDKVTNVKTGEAYRKEMTSGLYKIRDIFCIGCERGQAVGWTYVEAEEESQRFKQGRFIVSERMMGKQNWADQS